MICNLHACKTPQNLLVINNVIYTIQYLLKHDCQLSLWVASTKHAPTNFFSLTFHRVFLRGGGSAASGDRAEACSGPPLSDLRATRRS